MSNFFKLRIIEALFILFTGWFWYRVFDAAVVNEFFNHVSYTTTNYVGILIHEWISAAKPVFFTLVPAMFFAFIVAFIPTRRKKLTLFVVGIGLMLTLPSWVYNMRRWSPLLETIQRLPIKEVKYHRHTPVFLSASLPGMWVQFIIPRESFTEVKQFIETRLVKNKVKLLKYHLEDGHPLTLEFSADKRESGQIEARLYVRQAHEGYDY